MILSASSVESQKALAKATFAIDDVKLLTAYWKTTMYKLVDKTKGVEIWLHLSKTELEKLLAVLTEAYNKIVAEEELEDVYV